MFAQRFVDRIQGKEKRGKVARVDIVAEQVKKMLQASDQKIILMVRG